MDIYKIRIINTFHSLINCWTVKMFIKQFCHFCKNFLISLLTSKYSISQQYICINENQFHMKIRSLCYRLCRRGNGHIIWCQEKSVFLWSVGPRAEGRSGQMSWDCRSGSDLSADTNCSGTWCPARLCLSASVRSPAEDDHYCLTSASFSLLILISHIFLSASATC